MNNQQIRTLPSGFPQRFPRPDAFGLGQIVFGQDDPVSFFLAASHSHRYVAQLRAKHFFNLGIAVIYIAVNNDSFHRLSIEINRHLFNSITHFLRFYAP